MLGDKYKIFVNSREFFGRNGVFFSYYTLGILFVRFLKSFVQI